MAVDPCERIEYLMRCIGTLMKFDCTRCGKCCMVSGKHIHIERKLGERDYYCRDLLTNNLVIAHVESPYLPKFREKEVYQEENDQCHFLVRTPEGYSCVVYNTRPLSCRNFKCCRMRIYHGGKNLVGTIKGRRSLSTTDQDLEILWNDRIRVLEIADDGQWDMKVKKILEDTGYTVELYNS